MSNVRLYAIAAERRQAEQNIEAIRGHIAHNSGLIEANTRDRDALKPQIHAAHAAYNRAIRNDQGTGFGFEVGIIDYRGRWDRPSLPPAARQPWEDVQRLTAEVHQFQIEIDKLEGWNAEWRRRIGANESVLANLEQEDASLRGQLAASAARTEHAGEERGLLAEVRARLVGTPS